jgi:NAD(P)-dependent dehydrogenase (short-subunit alcohol dehydrogenase family)
MNTPLIHAHDDVLDVHSSAAETLAARDAMSPTCRQGTAWDIANVSVFLANDQAAHLNGVVLSVDGGLIAKQAAQPHPLPEDLQ